MKTLREQADEFIQSYDAQREAAEFEPDPFLGQQKTFQTHLAGQRYGYVKGCEAALASIQLDEGDLLGCCADYAQLEADGNGTAGMFLSDYPAEIISQAYYEGAKLAVERVKEGKWAKK